MQGEGAAAAGPAARGIGEQVAEAGGGAKRNSCSQCVLKQQTGDVIPATVGAVVVVVAMIAPVRAAAVGAGGEAEDERVGRVVGACPPA